MATGLPASCLSEHPLLTQLPVSHFPLSFLAFQLTFFFPLIFLLCLQRLLVE